MHARNKAIWRFKERRVHMIREIRKSLIKKVNRYLKGILEK